MTLGCTRSVLALTVAAAALSACSGGGGTPPDPATPVRAGAAHGRGTLSFTVKWPPKKTTAGTRRPAYFSPNTACVRFTIAPPGVAATTTDVPNPNYTGPATGTGSTTITIGAPLGISDVTISAYDATGGSSTSTCSGSLLSAVDLPAFDVVEKQANSITATLDGNLKSILPMATPSTYINGTDPPYTLYGAVAETLTLVPLDADQNVIIAPGVIPTLTLTSGTPTAVRVANTATTNRFTISALEPDQTVTLVAAGTDLAGAAVTDPITVKTIGLVYVTDRGPNGTAPSVTIYPSNATADTPPLATIAGAMTQEVQLEYPAADPGGTVLVSNLGPAPAPNPTFGPTSGYVSAFSPASVPLTVPAAAAPPVNAAPAATLSGINKPTGLTFDAAGNLYVMSVDRITVYPPTANGLNGTTATPARTIAGPTTGLSACYGVFVGKDGLIYAACSNLIEIFAKTATGNVAPVQTIHSPGTVFMNGGVVQGSFSFLSVAADTAGNIYASSANNNVSTISVYAKGTTDPTTGPAPTASNTVTGAPGSKFSQPSVFVDSADKIYVTSVAAPSAVPATPNDLQIYANMTNFIAGMPAATITSGINVPMGVYVR